MHKINSSFRDSIKILSAILGSLLFSMVAITNAAQGKTLLSIPVPSPDGLGTVISGNAGTIKVVAKGPSTVCLAAVENFDVENCFLIYQAQIKTHNLKGKAFLEMWCHFPGKGDFFSRGLKTALTGDTNWKTVNTSFLLQPGQKPTRVTLSLVVAGAGEVWIREPALVEKERP